MNIRRIDQKLAKEFAKDIDFEYILASLNECLCIEEDKILRDEGDIFPTLHIIGVPRSGTTLACQLVFSYLHIGYINNLIAAFWKAPIYGIELSRKLLGVKYKSTFNSTFGRTNSIYEPHEFGYFWNYILRYNSLQQQGIGQESLIDWSHLGKILNNMTYHFKGPIVFKSFLFGFHAQRAFKEIPKTCFMYIKRDFLDNAFSILKLRKKLNGNINEWGSIKPLQFEQLKDLSPYEQIAGQILCMEHEYLSQLEGLPAQNKLFFQYENMCKNPTHFLEKVNDLLTKHYNSGRGSQINDIPGFQIAGTKISSGSKEQAKLFIAAGEKIKKLFPDLLEWKE